MASEKISSQSTGIPELDAIIKATSKKFKKDMGPSMYADVLPIPTGSSRLDHMLGIGGIPRSRVIEIFGWESSCKTSLALSIIANAQAMRKENGENKRDLFIDLEHSMTPSFIAGFGIDLDQVVWRRPDTAEEALQMAIDYPKSGAIDMVLFDSVDAAQNNKQLSRTVGETDVGGISKDMNFALRQISKICTKTNTTYLFINQIKQNPGISYGSGNVTPGGNALKFYASMRLELLKSKPSPDITGAALLRVKVVKTKVAAPPSAKQGALELDFIYGHGFEPKLDLIALAKELKLVRFAGGSSVGRWSRGEEEFRISSTGGKMGAYEWLGQGDNFARLREACLSTGHVHGEETEDE